MNHRFCTTVGGAAALAASMLTAPVAGAPGEVLILEEMVSGGLSSLEAVAVVNAGRTPVLINAATWATLTTAQFADYDAIVIGDPFCTGSIPPEIAASTCIWNPAVTGNVIIIGTDPTFHQSQGGQQLADCGIAFALGQPTTGAYITLSCAYGGPSGQPVPELDGFCTPCVSSPPCFTVTGELGCFDDAHLVATSPTLTACGLTDGDLSNWSCSVHEAFETWPADFIPLAMAVVPGGPYTAPDGTEGFPYIMARGDVVPVGGCMDVEPEEVLCVLDDSGCVDYTFTITNNSGVVAEYLLFPSGDIEPNVIDLDSVSGDGGMATVTITICGAPPGEEYCFDMILADAAFDECCPTREHCLDIPLCDCGQVHSESFECTGVANDFVYTFTLDNLFPGDIYHAFVVDLPAGVTADPDYFDLVALGGPVPQYGSIVLSTTIIGATAGDEICFRVTTHIESLEECCAFEVCISVPDCGSPLGACCLCFDGCAIRTQADCDAIGGRYDGDGSECTGEFGDVCLFAIGGCCFEDGTCAEALSECECAAAGGVLGGDPCPEFAPGSCCLPDLSCVNVASECQCTFLGGTSFQLGGDCSGGECGTPCPGDCNSDNDVDFADLLILLSEWGQADAQSDINGDGTVDFADLLLLLGAWGPC